MCKVIRQTRRLLKTPVYSLKRPECNVFHNNVLREQKTAEKIANRRARPRHSSRSDHPASKANFFVLPRRRKTRREKQECPTRDRLAGTFRSTAADAAGWRGPTGNYAAGCGQCRIVGRGDFGYAVSHANHFGYSLRPRS